MKIDTIIFDLSGTLVKMRPPTLLGDAFTLQKLSQQYNLCIVTGGPRTEVTNILNKLNIPKLFKVIITKNDTRLRKPNPDLLKLCLKLTNSNYPIYIGDTLKDFEMAEEAKVPFIFIGKKKIGKFQLSSLKEFSLLLLSEGN